MSITPKEVISLCEDTPITYPQIDGYAIAKIYDNARIHVHFENLDYYLVVTKNEKELYSDISYHGAILVVRRKGQKANCNLEMHYLYIDAAAVVFSNYVGQDMISTAGSREDDIVWDTEKDEEVRIHFRTRFHTVYTLFPLEFEKNLQKYSDNKPLFHRYADHISF